MKQHLLDRLRSIDAVTPTSVLLTKGNLDMLIDALQQSILVDELTSMPDVSIEFQNVTPRDKKLRAVTAWKMDDTKRMQHSVRTGYSFTSCLKKFSESAVRIGLRARRHRCRS